MIGRHFGRMVHVPGALSADLEITLSVPVDCRIHRISAVASNDSDAEITLGIDAQNDDILSGETIGDSGTPVVFDVDDWGADNPLAQLSKGDVLVIAVDFDGDNGTAAQDLTLDIDFLEG